MEMSVIEELASVGKDCFCPADALFFEGALKPAVFCGFGAQTKTKSNAMG